MLYCLYLGFGIITNKQGFNVHFVAVVSVTVSFRTTATRYALLLQYLLCYYYYYNYYYASTLYSELLLVDLLFLFGKIAQEERDVYEYIIHIYSYIYSYLH